MSNRILFVFLALHLSVSFSAGFSVSPYPGDLRSDLPARSGALRQARAKPLHEDRSPIYDAGGA